MPMHNRPLTSAASLPTHEILRRLAVGRDTAAWGALLEQHGAELLRVCRRILRDEALAEDAVQETLLKIRDRAGQFRGTGSDPEPAACDWVRRTACTTALQLLRTRARERRRGMWHATQSNRTRQAAQDGTRNEDTEHTARVREELDKLPEYERMPLLLRFYGEMEYEQVALTLGCPVGTAKTRVHRGLEKLRRRLALLGLVLSLSTLGEMLRGAELLAAETCPPQSQQLQNWQSLLQSSRSSVLPDFQPPSGGFSLMVKLSSLIAVLALACLLLLAARDSNGEDQPVRNSPPTKADEKAAPAPINTARPIPTLTPAKPASEPAQPPTLEECKTLAKGNNAFALDFFARLRVEHKENLFFSPYSISSALAMTYAGAHGETETEMAQALHFKLPQERLHATMGALIADLNAEQKDGKPRGFALRVANSLWGLQGYPFKAAFLELTKDTYGAPLTEVDFLKAPDEARLAINKWVEGKTQEKIKGLIAPGGITADMRLVLVNAIYFKGDWQSPFDEKRTKAEPFHLTAEKKIEAPLMQQTGSFRYYEEDKQFQLLELPYVKRELSMLVFLPATVEGLPGLENALTSGNLEKWTAALKYTEARVALPKFKLTWGTKDLIPALKELGMKKAFKYPEADFSGMADKVDTEELYIGMVLHKAFVEVNEKGTEAAAATGVGTLASAPPSPRSEPKVFRADRPFVFAIRDNTSGSILFMGRMANPKP